MNSIEPFVVLLDRSGRATWASRGDSGVSRDDLIGTTMWDWTVPADCREAQRAFAECLLYERPQDFFVTVCAHGQLVRQHVWLHYTGGPARPVIVKSAAVPPGLDSLTSRQAEILRLLGAGKSRKQIAREISLKLVTVDAHCSAICERLGLTCATELAVFAILHSCHL